MEELQIITLENTDIGHWDMATIREQLEQNLAYYRGIIYTDDNIKSAKDNRAILNKAKSVIEDARKAYKEKCLEPYKAMEPQIKELVDMIDEQRSHIDMTVKDYENRQKEEKELEVKAYYDKKAFVLGEYAESLYESLRDPKWLNASTGKAKYEEGVQIAINNALADINEIKAFKSPFEASLIETYINSLSMETVRAKNEELINACKSITSNSAKLSPEQAVANQEAKMTSDSDEGTLLKVHASQSQLNQITDFLKAIGVEYELQ